VTFILPLHYRAIAAAGNQKHM